MYFSDITLFWQKTAFPSLYYLQLHKKPPWHFPFGVMGACVVLFGLLFDFLGGVAEDGGVDVVRLAALQGVKYGFDLWQSTKIEVSTLDFLPPRSFSGSAPIAFFFLFLFHSPKMFITFAFGKANPQGVCFPSHPLWIALVPL